MSNDPRLPTVIFLPYMNSFPRIKRRWAPQFRSTASNNLSAETSIHPFDPFKKPNESPLSQNHIDTTKCDDITMTLASEHVLSINSSRNDPNLEGGESFENLKESLSKYQYEHQENDCTMHGMRNTNVQELPTIVNLSRGKKVFRADFGVTPSFNTRTSPLESTAELTEDHVDLVHVIEMMTSDETQSNLNSESDSILLQTYPKCSKCSIAFQNQKLLSIHLFERHGYFNQNIFECYMCDVISKTAEERTNHLQSAHYMTPESVRLMAEGIPVDVSLTAQDLSIDDFHGM